MAKRANRSGKGCRVRGFVTQGLIVGRGMVKTDPEKTGAVREWAVPKNKKELQAFIGFFNYYRRFIRDFSKIARPLLQLTGNHPFIWDAERPVFQASPLPPQ